MYSGLTNAQLKQGIQCGFHRHSRILNMLCSSEVQELCGNHSYMFKLSLNLDENDAKNL